MQHGWDANGSPVEDEAPAEEAEPTPDERIAQYTASCNAMEAALKEAGFNVNIGQVNIADLRIFATAAAALRLLQAKGLASAQEVELATLSVLHEFLGGMLMQVEAQRLTATAQQPPSRKGPPLAIARSMPPTSAQIRRTRDD